MGGLVRRVYDVSVPLRHDGVVYPGNPAIRIEYAQSVAGGDSANVSSVCLGSHTGTHVDALSHFIDGGQNVDRIPLERLIGPAVLVEIPLEARAIEVTHLERHDLRGHTRVLLKTRNSALLREQRFFQDYTYLTPAGAAYLVSRGCELVGIDYYSVEQFHSGHHRTHKTLLDRGVVIVEGLDLSEPPPGDYELVCLPLRLEGRDGAPARAALIAYA